MMTESDRIRERKLGKRKRRRSRIRIWRKVKFTIRKRNIIRKDVRAKNRRREAIETVMTMIIRIVIITDHAGHVKAMV